MAIIRMRDHLYDEIVNYAKEHLPEEACGLLAGAEKREEKSKKYISWKIKIMPKTTLLWTQEIR